MRSINLVLPTLMRELRQELRMGSFGLFFAVPHGIAGIIMLIQACMEPSANSFKEGVSILFYICLFIPLTGLLPARAFASLSKDAEAGSLQLMSLTKLSSWHIAAGKLGALAAMSLLFVSVMAPYAVLQYFFGGVSPLLLLGKLVELWLVSILACGFILALASLKQRGSAALMFINWLIAAPVIAIFTFNSGSRLSPVGMNIWSSGGTFVTSLIITILCLALTVETAASKIANPTEDHGGRKRLTAAICLGGLFAITLYAKELKPMALMCLYGCAAPVILTSLLERSSPSLVRRIARQGGGLRWFVCTGWPAGLLTVAVVEAVVILASLLALDGKQHLFWPFYLMTLSGTLFPYVLISALSKSSNITVAPYVTVQMVSLALLPFATSKTYTGLSMCADIIGQGSLLGLGMAIWGFDQLGVDYMSRLAPALLAAAGFLTISLAVLTRRFSLMLRGV